MPLHPLQTNPMLNLQNPFHQIHQKPLQNPNRLFGVVKEVTAIKTGFEN